MSHRRTLFKGRKSPCRSLATIASAHVRIASYHSTPGFWQAGDNEFQFQLDYLLEVRHQGLWNKRSRLHAAVQTEQEQILRDDFYIQ